MRQACCVTLFWTIGAALVIAVHVAIEPWSAKAAAATTIGALIATAYGYSRLAAADASVTHALGVGIVWLVLSIATELVLAARLRHGWFSLLGPPDHPLFRNVMLFVWIFAPAIFARQEAA